MELVYQGFDGLDISFQSQVPLDLCNELEDAKTEAQKRRSDVLVTWKGIRLLVGESSARGGYAYRASTGEFGATWFFKKPNSRDPWGVRVSCGSFQLAINGIAGTRNILRQTMEVLGLRQVNGHESIGRVDYALDFLAPRFELDPSSFVMHSNSVRADHTEIFDIETHGVSWRTTSVMIGKMPGRQVIVYDKRAEIIAHNKPAWWGIWNATREKAGLVPLEKDDAKSSRVWRVELRAGKKYLKDRWRIASWTSLLAIYGDVIADTLESVRHSEPTVDSNRSRWPNSDLWELVKAHAFEDLFELRNYASPDLVRKIQREVFCEMLEKQMDGLAVTQAAVRGIPLSSLPEFAGDEGKQRFTRLEQNSHRYVAKYDATLARYEISHD